MDEHFVHTPFFWLRLEFPHLRRNIFEDFDKHLKSPAVEFNLFITFFAVHTSSIPNLSVKSAPSADYFVGSHNSTLFPSGSINQPNEPYSIFSISPMTSA